MKSQLQAQSKFEKLLFWVMVIAFAITLGLIYSVLAQAYSGLMLWALMLTIGWMVAGIVALIAVSITRWSVMGMTMDLMLQKLAESKYAH